MALAPETGFFYGSNSHRNSESRLSGMQNELRGTVIPRPASAGRRNLTPSAKSRLAAFCIGDKSKITTPAYA